MPIRKKRRIVNSIPFRTEHSEELLSEEEACKLFGLKLWTNSIIPFGQSEEDPDITTLMHDAIVETKLLQCKIAIEEVDVDGEKMYGLVAIDTIHQGESIIYGAKQHTVEEAGSTTDDFYKISMSQDTIVSAKNFGNIARFMNHAPDKNDAPGMLEFLEEDIKTLATANFISREVRIDSLRYSVLEAGRTIKAGERLYWDYGIEYFRQLPVPIALFDNRGKRISPDTYRWKNQQLQFEILGMQKVIGNLNSILKNDAILECAVAEHTPPFYLNIHARYIKAILEQNPSLADNYFVKIPTPDLDNPLVKIFNVDDQKTIIIIHNHLRAQIIPQTISQQQVTISLNRYKDSESDSSRFARTNTKFFSFKIQDAAIIQQIRNTCEQLNIECHIDYKTTHVIYVSMADLFANLPGLTLAQLQPPNPVQTPVRGISFLQPNLPVHNVDGVVPEALVFG